MTMRWMGDENENLANAPERQSQLEELHEQMWRTLPQPKFRP